MMRSILAILLFISLPISSWGRSATEMPDTTLRLSEVVVTARQRPLATVQTLSGRNLQAMSTTTIADALKYFAGVQIKDYGGLGGLKTVNVRSLGAQHVGVYIDGIRITNAQNGTVDLGKYSLSTLESVSLYNANKLEECQSASEYASGATVYLRTRRPTSDSATVAVRGASFHTYGSRGNVQFARKGWSGFVDAEYLSTKGDYPFRYRSQWEDTVGRRDNSDIAYGRVEAALFKGGFSSHLYFYDSERGCPGGIVRRLSDKYTNIGREWDRDMFAQASWQHEFGRRCRVKFNTKYSNEYLRYCTDYSRNQNTAKVNNHYRLNDAYASASYAFLPWEGVWLNAGYDARMSWLDADLKRFAPVRRLDQKGVIAANARYRNANLSASILYQHYKDYTRLKTGAAEPLSRFTPATAAGYSLGPVTLRGWYKRIFRAPTLNDLYYTQAGNRNLKPEYTRQLNFGAEYTLVNTHWSVTAQADIYRNRIENRIVCLPLKGTYTWSMMNYGETLCHGLNANTSATYTLRDWRWTLNGSLTLQRDVNRTDPSNEATYDMPICYSPRLSYGITAIAAWRSLSVSVSQLHVSERIWSYADPDDRLAPYDNIDLKVDYAWRRWRGSIEINDLLDVQYEHIPRYPMPGRSIRFTLSMSIF